jgi:hypothetical protein
MQCTGTTEPGSPVASHDRTPSGAASMDTGVPSIALMPSFWDSVNLDQDAHAESDLRAKPEGPESRSCDAPENNALIAVSAAQLSAPGSGAEFEGRGALRGAVQQPATSSDDMGKTARPPVRRVLSIIGEHDPQRRLSPRISLHAESASPTPSPPGGGAHPHFEALASRGDDKEPDRGSPRNRTSQRASGDVGITHLAVEFSSEELDASVVDHHREQPPALTRDFNTCTAIKSIDEGCMDEPRSPEDGNVSYDENQAPPGCAAPAAAVNVAEPMQNVRASSSCAAAEATVSIRKNEHPQKFVSPPTERIPLLPIAVTNVTQGVRQAKCPASQQHGVESRPVEGDNKKRPLSAIETAERQPSGSLFKSSKTAHFSTTSRHQPSTLSLSQPSTTVSVHGPLSSNMDGDPGTAKSQQVQGRTKSEGGHSEPSVPSKRKASTVIDADDRSERCTKQRPMVAKSRSSSLGSQNALALKVCREP